MLKNTVLITSGSYVVNELAAEFGRLPPTFLPVGNRRLFVKQVAQLREYFERIVLTVPDDYHITEMDHAALHDAGVELIALASTLSLRDAILRVAAVLDQEEGGLSILHGDTLMMGMDYSLPDSLSVDFARFYYNWAATDIVDGYIRGVRDMLPDRAQDQDILTGYFNFADIRTLILSMSLSNSFVEGVDRYVRRRPMRPVRAEQWLDFGHLHTYYLSRSAITTERAFNALAIEDRVVVKTSAHAHRIDAEAGWYETVPRNVQMFTPRYLGRTDEARPGYRLEFLYNASLADLFVFGELPSLTWKNILQSCQIFLAECRKHTAPAGTEHDAMQLYLPKTLARLEEFSIISGVDLSHPWRYGDTDVPSLLEIANAANAWIRPVSADQLAIIHGDFCFSNILYDFRSQSIRVIDPRGQTANGAATIWGDVRYDLAKLHHSVHGLYDYIVAGSAHAVELGDYHLGLHLPASASARSAGVVFDALLEREYSADRASIAAISLLLFLSMLPLHADDPRRQRALLANALRLYVDQKGSA